jgi:signal transduction histidine kinase
MELRTAAIVDDDPAFSDSLGRAIAAKYPTARILTFYRATTALEALRDDTEVQVVFLDYRLPDLDGEAVLAELRTLERDLGVIVVTGFGDEELASELFRLGADDYLMKARLDGTRLVRAVDNTLGRMQLKAAVREAHESLESQVEERTRELAEANRALRKADQLRRELLSHVTHELRTPLNSIIGYADLLRQGVYGSVVPKQKETLEKLIGRADVLLAMIEQILAFSRLEAYKVALREEAFDLGEMLAEVMETARLLLRNLPDEVGDVELRTPADPTDVRVRTDRGALKQILENLLDNAVKFTEDGWIQLEWSAGAEGLTVEVSDSGPGVQPGDLEFIFEPFFQAQQEGRRPRAGTGLGLAISRRLAELLGGELNAGSDGEGGARFVLELPGTVLDSS